VQQIQFIETATGQFAYLSGGTGGGPLILCLHGFPDSPRSFLPLLERLAAAGHRWAAPWMRGYAPSVLTGPYHAEQLAADVHALARALSPDAPVVVLGHDWGAVAGYVAASQPGAEISRLVAMAAPHPLAFLKNTLRRPAQLRRSWYMGLFQLRGIAERILARDDFALVDTLWRRWSPGHAENRELRDEIKHSLAASMPAPLEYYRAMLWPPRAALQRIREAGAGERRIRLPVLHLQGERDGCIHPEVCVGQEQYFAGPFTSLVVPGVGHFLQLDDPERVARHVLDFLAAADGTSARAHL
jgi:pimeloyl-ACP methyl ester carboxylesterase